MQTEPSPTATAAKLRRCAEDRLREQHPDAGPDRSEADTQRLLHELQVHQIELEMQQDELQQTTDQLELEREKFSDLYDFAPVGYLTLDREGAIHEANLTSASLLDVDRSLLLRQRFGHFVAPADRPTFNAFLQKVFNNKTREFCELTILRADKSTFDARLDAAVSASGLECRVALTDITDRKRAELDRLILSKLESTGILAAGIAHDFNNLLTVVLMNLELGRMAASPDAEWVPHLDEALKATLLARGLTQQILTFAKGGEPLRKPTSVSAVVRESARPAVSGSRVRCDFTEADDLWCAEVDAGQIGQVIRNLVLNAREAMPEGGVIRIQTKNVVLAAGQHPHLPAGDYVRLSVADHGGGIPKDVLPNIFDPYFSTKQRGEQRGMGLGLTICHSVVKKHGGAISVESVPPVGTTFHVRLPASRKPIPPVKTPPPAGAPRCGKILVMDDEEGVRHGVGAMLRRLGHEVELTEDGQKAIDAYRSARELGRPFDAVLLDLTVRGGMGGQQAIRALRKLDPAVRAIVMSGYADDPVILDHQHHGFVDALTKPFELAALKGTVSRLLGSAVASPRTP